MKILLNTFLGICALGCGLLLLFQGYLFPEFGGGLNVALRIFTGLFTQWLLLSLTRKPFLRAIPTIIALVVAVLGAISAYEREINAERREYGYRKALEKKIVGRPNAEATPEFLAAYNAWQAKEITGTEAIRRSGLGRTTFYKLAKEMGAEG